MSELDRLIKVITICREGECSQCEYIDDCMDGIIDDTYNFLMELKNNERN